MTTLKDFDKLNKHFVTLSEEELMNTDGGEIVLGTLVGIAALGFAVGQALARKYK